MAVVPMYIDATTGLHILDQETGDEEDITIADPDLVASVIDVATNDRVVLTCAASNSVSYHPLAGGSNPELIQVLIAVAYRLWSGLPLVTTWAEAIARVETRAVAAGGDDAYRIPAGTVDPVPSLASSSIP